MYNICILLFVFEFKIKVLPKNICGVQFFFREIFDQKLLRPQIVQCYTIRNTDSTSKISWIKIEKLLCKNSLLCSSTSN